MPINRSSDLPRPLGDPSAELASTQARLDALVSMLSSVVWTTGADGRFAERQLGFERFTAFAWEMYRGFGWIEAIHPEDRPAMLASWEQSRTGATPYRAQPRIWSALHRSWRRCDMYGMPLFDEDGSVREWIGVCNDVEDRIRDEEEARVAASRKDEFIAVLAHELRNPLGPIRNAAHIVGSRAGSDPRIAWAHDVIERQLTHMSRLLDDLLDVSRITRNKLELKKERITLGAVIDAAVETTRPMIDRRGHTLKVELPEDQTYLDADFVRLAQVFGNLLANAAKYMDQGGLITLTATRQGGEVVVTVEDVGIGMDAETQRNLFRMFSQGSSARSRADGGLGIGLSLVLGIVELHGGLVAARSEGPGRGSAFTVRLPLVPAPEVPPAPREVARGGEHPTNNLRILIADDNRDAADTLALLLQTLGHEVVTAYDGVEAVERAALHRPTVAILDIGMPRLDGYAAAMRIRSLLPDTVLVALTGWGQAQDVRKSQAAGFWRHLVKPVSPHELTAILGQLPVSPSLSQPPQ